MLGLRPPKPRTRFVRFKLDNVGGLAVTMKLHSKLFVMGAVLVVLIPATTAAQTAPAAPTDPCTAEAKNALYTKFLANRTGPTAENAASDQEVALKTAKEYKKLCPADESDPAQFMAKWAAKYEVQAPRIKFLSAYDNKKYAEMFSLGTIVLAADPNYVRAYVLLGIVGYVASVAGNNSHNAESLPYAKKAIALLEAGQTPDDWKPYAGKDDALAWLNYSIGHSLKASPKEALPYLLKAARYEGIFKTNPLTYVGIAEAYELGYYAKQEEDYKQYTGKDESPEQRLALQNIFQTADRIIDAYARAIALAGTDPKFQQSKLWKEAVTDLYKFRNNGSDAGLTALLAGIQQKPLPEIPSPITTLPTPPAAAATPTPTATPTPAPGAKPE